MHESDTAAINDTQIKQITLLEKDRQAPGRPEDDHPQGAPQGVPRLSGVERAALAPPAA